MKPVHEDPLPTRWSLIARLKNLNDQDSWRVFFDTYKDLIHGVATKTGLSHSEADDVVQETVMSVCKHIGAFETDKSRGSFKAWLLQMTRWRIVDQVRRRRVEMERLAVESRDDLVTRMVERVVDPKGNELEVIWDEAWKRHMIDSALEEVKRNSSAIHFQIFYLLIIKEKTPQEVASSLQYEISQIYLIKHRLSKLMEKALRDMETTLG